MTSPATTPCSAPISGRIILGAGRKRDTGLSG
jgi:hypothetical protein